MTRTNYKLVCTYCAHVFDDDGFVLECPKSHGPALLRTVYVSSRLQYEDAGDGIYRYNCWLPAVNRLAKPGRLATFRSERLARSLGLHRLWISFSGYWPTRGATLATATFKELEAYGVLSRVPRPDLPIPVVASAGNTAAAFARTCSENRIPCLLVLPKNGIKRMVFPELLASCVKTVCVTGRADYGDAIALAEVISREEGFFCEGGVRNVGRRDGMATAMLNAVETIGHLPDYYFQAIGSGAGAIAAHEAATRLVQDGRFGDTVPRLMLSQNSPFTPIYDSWRRGLRELVDFGEGDPRTRTKAILATVLSNRRPPYAIPGGIFDVLTESQGDMFAVDNVEARQAMRMFERCERIDIDAAAGVALAALIKAAASHKISRDSTILLHVTGGGFRLKTSEAKMVAVSPDLEVSPEEFGTLSVVDKIRGLFAKECKPERGSPNRSSSNARMHAV